MRLFGIALLAVALGQASHSLADDPPLDGTGPLDTPLVCLARTIYFEARGQGDDELAAVGHVVLNRVAHKDFPDGVCAVIKEGGPEAPCQFSWWCDGKSDTAFGKQEYRRAVRIARQILAGDSEDPTRGAVMFHNLSVKPSWTKSAQSSVRIGDQVFYALEDR